MIFLSNSDKFSTFSLQLLFNCVFECGDFSVLQSCECVCWTPPRGVYEPSGHTCVAGGYSDGTVRIFSLESAEMVLKLQPQPVSVCALQYSHYGERVCVRLSVLCLVLFVCLCSLYACVCVGHVLLSAGRDGLITVSSPATGVTVRTISDHKGAPITTVQCTSKQVCVCMPVLQGKWLNIMMWNYGPYPKGIWGLTVSHTKKEVHEIYSKTLRPQTWRRKVNICEEKRILQHLRHRDTYISNDVVTIKCYFSVQILTGSLNE